MRSRLTAIPRTERLAWGILLVAALAVRLIDLGSRPYHHDESQIAYFSWVFAEKGDYEYNPLLHAPFQYMVSALDFLILGASDFTARLPAVGMSMVAVGLAFTLRRHLGRAGALTLGVLIAFSPTFLYYSRFIREDIMLAAVNLGLLVAISFFLSAPKVWHPALIGGLVALAFGIKEATFITAGLAGMFFVGWYLLAWRTARRKDLDLRRHPLAHAIRSVGLEAWGWALATFLVVYTLIFTTFLTDPQHWDALYEGLDYWWGQHGIGRGEKEKYFYSVVLVAHEWPVVLLGAVGAYVSLKRRFPLGIFLVWMFVMQLLAYSIANERFSWLVLHPLLPLAALAGIGVQAVWDNRRATIGKLGVAATAIGLLYVGYATFTANAQHGANPVEFLVTTQSAQDVADVADEVIAKADAIKRKTGKAATITVDGAEGATFPYAWYLRDYGVGYLDLTSSPAPPDSDIIVMTEPNRMRLESQLSGYDQRKFQFRVWWVRDYEKMRPGTFATWLLRRKVWNPTGGMTEWLLVKKS